jgi:TonB-linked SusC/RagA family outer membrane protein
MKKIILFIVLAALCLNFRAKAQPGTLLTGRVTDTLTNKPLHGATIKIKSSGVSASTDKNGNFTIKTNDLNGIIAISFVGYKTVNISFNETNQGPFRIALSGDKSTLKEVAVVSTGYETLNRERATGSFDLIDSALLNRSVSTNVLDRLNGVTGGLLFNQNLQAIPNASAISIRGTSSILANEQPLIVLDNFPYDGDPGNINPNDIQSVTVLKDAASASIWGVRAGNGVIVITTKKGKTNSPPVINFNSNLTISAKPDLFYTPQLTSAEFIGVEKFLFNQGHFYNLSDGYSYLTPVVDLLYQNQNGQITAQQLNNQLNAFMHDDVRSDMEKYLYRKPVNQQYALSIAGGGNANKYYISAGFDDNLQPLVTNSYDRVTINANNTYTLIKNRLEWTAGLMFTQSTAKANANNFIPSTPYEMLKDQQGNNLAVVPSGGGLRGSYIDTAGSGKLLNWQDIPLNDNYADQTTTVTDYRFSNQLTLKILPGLQFSGQYLYEKGVTDIDIDYPANSYYVRNLVNTYSQIDPVSGQVTQGVPDGDIVDKNNSSYTLNTGRLQLNYDKQFAFDHHVTALVGFEASSNSSFGDTYTFYGYNPSTASNANQSINFADYYQQYYGYNNGQIPTGLSSDGTIDRNRSYFANASYTYKKRYIISGSARRDESNIFGVSTNQKGVPLWSAGLKWQINDEPFYKLDFLPLLAFRATYGYNGNTDKSTTAYLTALYAGGVNSFNAPFIDITNPPNPALRWEKVGVTNLGLDFGLKNNIVCGSLEYYVKNATDLIANSPLAPQTGNVLFRGNAADMRDNGVDIQLNVKILRSALNWNTMVFFNFVTNKVTHYEVSEGTNQDIINGNYLNPLVGYPLYSIFSYPNARLDPKGNPQGYLNGQLSENYSQIENSTDPAQLKYNGSATPRYFGSLINNFGYKQFALSVGIGYKLDYYFRRTSLNYTLLYSYPGVGSDFQQADFANRWQKPGDENHTYVPSMIYPANPARDEFYNSSSVLVDRADNVRLQDIKLSYSLNKSAFPGLPFKTVQFYAYANNLAILWRANHDGLDPDSPYNPPTTKSISLGLNCSF